MNDLNKKVTPLLQMGPQGEESISGMEGLRRGLNRLEITPGSIVGIFKLRLCFKST